MAQYFFGGKGLNLVVFVLVDVELLTEGCSKCALYDCNCLDMPAPQGSLTNLCLSHHF